ncbi:TPA: PKD domain-containing protein, partial [Candidatus Woesearchaeota archaeon]|nr:PKD domain-containing protein [Candidatus Woesearchaeota archaeon]
TVMNSSAGWFESIITSTAYTNKKFSKQESVVWLEFIGSDGELEVVHPVKITIKNVNRAPEIVRFSPVDKPLVKIGEPVLLEVDAIDRDGDELTYEWNFGLGESKLGGTTKVERIFVSPGLKKVTLTISDGEQEVEHTFSIRVSNERVAVTEPISEAVDPYEYRVYIVDHNGVGQWVDPFESRTYVIQH